LGSRTRLKLSTVSASVSHRPSCRRVRPLLEHIENGDIDPTVVITHRMKLSDAPRGYDIFLNKQDGCEKVVLST